MNNIIANIRTQLQKLKCRIANLTNRVTYIENNCCNRGGGDTEIPDWQPQSYSQGDIVAHNEGIWRSEVEGNTDEPAECISRWEEAMILSPIDLYIIEDGSLPSIMNTAFAQNSTNVHVNPLLTTSDIPGGRGRLVYVNAIIDGVAITRAYYSPGIPAGTTINLSYLSTLSLNTVFSVGHNTIDCDTLAMSYFVFTEETTWASSECISDPIPPDLVCSWTLLADISNGGNGIQSIVAGDNIFIDITDPQNPIISSTGGEQEFVKITEGGNTGWGLKYRADNPNRYGDIGQDAVDLSYSADSSSTRGATGLYSAASGGVNNTASGHSSTVSGGYLNTASNDHATVSGGFQNTASGYMSTVSGGSSNTANSYAEWVGGLYGTIPTGQNATSFVATDRLFNIGNGTNTNARSDAFTILKNGLATLPSVTNTLIDAEPTGKAVVTKEWVEDAINAIPTPSITLEQARQNGNVLEGDVEMLPNTSLFAGEDSGQGATHYLRFIDEMGFKETVLVAEDRINVTSNSINLSTISTHPEREVNFHLISGDDFTPLSQATLSMDASTKGLVGSNEFDKQGDRKAFAQIADVEDFYTTITGYDAGETQTLKHVNGVLQWVTD